jgi:hypothetical protein
MNLRSFYGLSLEQFDSMVLEQEGRCKIFLRPERHLCIDHNHDTGVVRGLLCNPCNQFVAKLENYPELLPVVMEYVGYR